MHLPGQATHPMPGWRRGTGADRGGTRPRAPPPRENRRGRGLRRRARRGNDGRHRRLFRQPSGGAGTHRASRGCHRLGQPAQVLPVRPAIARHTAGCRSANPRSENWSRSPIPSSQITAAVRPGGNRPGQLRGRDDDAQRCAHGSPLRLDDQGRPGALTPIGPTLPGELTAMAASAGGGLIGYAIATPAARRAVPASGFTSEYSTCTAAGRGSRVRDPHYPAVDIG